MVLTFLDVYALACYTKGTTKGVIQVPAVPTLNIAPRQLQLNASFRGPTYGIGATLQGGTRISQAPEVLAFAVAGINQTKTDLSFSNEQLLEFGRHWGVLVEGGIGARKSILADVGYRF